jgi:hypothetical protein
VKGVDRKRCASTIVCAAPLIAWAMLSPACSRECPPETTKVLDQCLGPASTRDIPDQSSQGGGSGTGASDAGDSSEASDASDASDVSDAGDSSAVSDAPLIDGADSDGTDGDAPIDCGAGSIRAGSECIPRHLYVSPAGDDDANHGTSPDRPFRTFAKAMKTARAGQMVNFEPGEYGTNGTDDFSEPIPDLVILQRHDTEANATAGDVIFRADGGHSLVFASSGGLRRVTLIGFENPLKATTGDQVITDVAIVQSTGPVWVTGDAQMTLNSVPIIGAPVVVPNTPSYLAGVDAGAKRIPPSVLVDDRAHLNWSGSSLEGTYTACGNAHGIVVLGLGRLTLTGVALRGRWEHGIHVRGDGSLDLNFALLHLECGDSLWAEGVTGDLKIRISTQSEFHTNVRIGDNKELKVRDSWFHGRTGLYLTGTRNRQTDDLGTPADRGLNTFADRLGVQPDSGQQIGLQVYLWGPSGDPLINTVVHASGNIWTPNVQGADDGGLYPDGGTVTSPVGVGIERANYSLNGVIQLKL